MGDRVRRTEHIDFVLVAWQHKLGLDAWDIRYDPNAKPAKNHTANINWRNPEMAAVVRVHKDLPIEGIESVVVHELLHLVLKPAAVAAERLVSSSPEPLRTYAAGCWDDAEEVVIERLVRAFGLPAFTPYASLLPRWAVFENG